MLFSRDQGSIGEKLGNIFGSSRVHIFGLCILFFTWMVPVTMMMTTGCKNCLTTTDQLLACNTQPCSILVYFVYNKLYMQTSGCFFWGNQVFSQIVHTYICIYRFHAKSSWTRRPTHESRIPMAYVPPAGGPNLADPTRCSSWCDLGTGM